MVDPPKLNETVLSEAAFRLVAIVLRSPKTVEMPLVALDCLYQTAFRLPERRNSRGFRHFANFNHLHRRSSRNWAAG
jgi:hypothetical protein